MNEIPFQPSYRLIVRQDLRVVKTVELAARAYSIGRSSPCEILLPHMAVSRAHARLEHQADGWHIIDTHSANGIRINGRRVQEGFLNPGDVIEIRPFALNFMGGEKERMDQSILLADSGVTPTIYRDSRDGNFVIRQRLGELYDLSKLILRRKDDGSFWPTIQAALERALPADRCLLMGIDPTAGMYRLAPGSRPSERAQPLEVSRSVLGEVIETGRGLLIQRVSQDAKFAAAESLSGNDIGSVICVPLRLGEQTRAIVYADRQMSRQAFKGEDLDFVMAAVDLAAGVVEIDELQAQARELAHLKGRVDAAREIQQLLLPSPIPQPSWGEVAAANLPAEQVSGDIYDVLLDPKGRLIVSIADVCGKGMPAAFVTAILQNTLRQAVLDLESLDEIVGRLNAAISAYTLPTSFVTMILCRWSVSGQEVEIANAGHHAPLWVDSSGQVQAFPEELGFPLGIRVKWEGEIFCQEVSRWKAMLMSSDGIIEACDTQEQQYGQQRLGECFCRLLSQDAKAITTGITDEVLKFNAPSGFTDDMTLVIVKKH